MVESQTAVGVADRLLELAERLRADAGFAEVVAALKAGHGATLGGVWGSSSRWPRPRSPAKRREHCSSFALGPPTSIRCATTWLSSRRCVPERFPAWESSPGEGKIDDDIHGDRIRVLKLLAAQKGTVPFSSADSGKGDSPRRSLAPREGDSPLFFRGLQKRGQSPSFFPRPSPLAPRPFPHRHQHPKPDAAGAAAGDAGPADARAPSRR